MATLTVGDKAPEFSLPSTDGSIISLKDFKGKKVVLYFYPKDDTSGCTKEACSFRDNLARVKKKGAILIGVSADPVNAHKKFTDKYDLTFPLISDEEKSMYGRKYMGIERTTFVIDEKGKIAHLFPKV
ncbi:MAG TPA: peroxiredoxin, partial [Bacteroidota bacterium]|nr:peroxiredoxin [Bacteroidota bacterium]